jgi:para-aminobenzoate synthetase component I
MNRYPLIEELATSSHAPQLFELVKDRPYSFFLDSGMGHERLGRYSFLGSDPFLVMSSRGDAITLIRGRECRVQHGNPFDAVARLLEEYRLAPGSTPVPFVGGAVGYFAYDLCHFLERLPSTAVDDLELPECYLAFYDSLFAFDHLEAKAYVVATGFPESDEEQRLRRARMRVQHMKNWVQSLHSGCGALGRQSIGVAGEEPARGQEEEDRDRPCHVEARTAPAYGCKLGAVEEDDSAPLRSNFTAQQYIRSVSKVREYIAAGDVFQVNLSQRFEAALRIPPYELYSRLRRLNPAPFASYLNFPAVTIVSASPERFLRVQGDLVETRPIKGTRPRGKDAVEDRRLARELTGSLKDRAENVMIVDLERNDLGRVCRYGTVKVAELAVLEAFPTVFHLTSTIQGRLRPDRDSIDLLKAAFPGGSITGAPKVRAMEIIDELEPTRRSVYTGCLGYLSFDRCMDLSIVIRTLLIKGGRAYFQVGGGITYDSDPEAEYMETLDKAKALIRALKLAPRGTGAENERRSICPS